AAAAGVGAHQPRSLPGLDPEETARLIEPVVRAGEIVSLPAAVMRYVAAGAWSELAERVHSTLAAFHRKEPLKEGFPREELRTRQFDLLHPHVLKYMMAGLCRG